jgi:hypothetical protein
MRRNGIFASAVLLGLAAGAAPAFADFGAIAYDEHNCAVGRSWHFNNPERAKSVALGECGHPGCRVVLEVGPGQCGAIAVTPNCHGYGWAKRPSRGEAEISALNDCRHYTGAGDCTIRTSDCSH